jgi:probable addiction module antidote protein
MRKNTLKTIKKGKLKASESYEDYLVEKYRSKHYASLALQASLEETDEPRILCLVLQRIIKAHGGFTHVAKLTGMRREDLYRAVSLKTTPKIHVVYQILSALDIPFSFPKKKAA